MPTDNLITPDLGRINPVFRRRPGYIAPVRGTVLGTTATAPRPVAVPAHPIATLPPDCNDKRRILGGGLGFMFQSILKVSLGGAKADVPLNVGMPDAHFIMVSGCDNAHFLDSLYMHFTPTGKSYSGNIITALGDEPWFPFGQQPSNLTKIGLFYEFSEPLPPTIYFDIGQEAGGSDYKIGFLLARSRAVIPGSMFASVT